MYKNIPAGRIRTPVTEEMDDVLPNGTCDERGVVRVAGCVRQTVRKEALKTIEGPAAFYRASGGPHSMSRIDTERKYAWEVDALQKLKFLEFVRHMTLFRGDHYQARFTLPANTAIDVVFTLGQGFVDGGGNIAPRSQAFAGFHVRTSVEKTDATSGEAKMTLKPSLKTLSGSLNIDSGVPDLLATEDGIIEAAETELELGLTLGLHGAMESFIPSVVNTDGGSLSPGGVIMSPGIRSGAVAAYADTAAIKYLKLGGASTKLPLQADSADVAGLSMENSSSFPVEVEVTAVTSVHQRLALEFLTAYFGNGRCEC